MRVEPGIIKTEKVGSKRRLKLLMVVPIRRLAEKYTKNAPVLQS